MSTCVSRVQNAEAACSLLNVRFSSGLAALISTKIRLNLMNSNLTNFQTVCCLYYMKRADILRSFPVPNTAHSRLLSAVQITGHCFGPWRKSCRFFPLSYQRHYIRAFSFPQYNRRCLCEFPVYPSSGVSLCFLFQSGDGVTVNFPRAMSFARGW